MTIGDLPYRCFVFDFDGTLVQSNRIKYETYFDTVRELPGAERVLEAILDDPKPTDREQVFQRLVARLGVGDPNALAAAYTRYCEDRIARCPEVPGARRLLQALRLDARLAFVNSGTPENALVDAVRVLGLEPYFKGVFGRPTSKVENLVRAFRVGSVVAAECLVIGDSESDRAAAAQAGCPFVGVRSDANDFSIRPRFLVDDLMPMLNAVQPVVHQ